jgi:hypothetical protein
MKEGRRWELRLEKCLAKQTGCMVLLGEELGEELENMLGEALSPYWAID